MGPSRIFRAAAELGSVMSRVVFEPGQQRKFLEEVNASGLTWKQIAEVSGCCDRTIRDWRREKYTLSYEVAIQLKDVSGVALPLTAKVLPEYWSNIKAAKAGGIARTKLHANPGTPEGRRKGGLASQARRRENPELYKTCVARKTITKAELSPLLAEFVGLMLGDGGIQKHQITITLNSETDVEYGKFVTETIKKLFGVVPFTFLCKPYKAFRIVASGANLVDYLCEIGLKRGNKVKQQVGVPSWIFSDENHMRACVRGLIDTDGCVFSHKYKVAGKTYQYVKVVYTSRSLPLLNDVEKILTVLGFHPRNNAYNRVYLDRVADVYRYFAEVGTSNPKHLIRYGRFINH